MKQFLLIWAISFLNLSYASGGTPATKAPLLLKADQLRHEEDMGIVIADGHVVASNGHQIVEAALGQQIARIKFEVLAVFVGNFKRIKSMRLDHTLNNRFNHPSCFL